MSLDTVVEDIREEARERAEEIRDDADAEAADIIEEAEADAKDIREEAREEAERQIKQEREQARSSAKLEAKQKRLEARRDMLGQVYDEVEAQLADLESDRREELTRALLDAALEEFNDETLEVYGRSDDEDLLTEILADYENCTYAGDVDCLGGVVVEGTTSNVRVNNTFDSTLETVWESNLQSISQNLFEQ